MRQRVLVALLDEAQAYQRLQAAAAREAASRTGIELEVVFAENNAIVQVHQLFERIHAPEAERPAAIVMQSVSGEGLERVARNAVANDIGWFLTKVPRLERVLFTGKTAEALFRRHILEPEGWPHLVAWDGGNERHGLIHLVGLPSPSRRNTMPYAEKVRAYRDALCWVTA